jgi:DNA-binding response OmpR family regulator
MSRFDDIFRLFCHARSGRAKAGTMSKMHIRVLLVEDNLADAKIVKAMLRATASATFDIDHSRNLADGKDRIIHGGIDVVLLDLALPDSHGLETFVAMHAYACDVPIVVLTGFDDERLATDAVRQGAQDYLVKEHIEPRQLACALSYAIERQRRGAVHKLAHEPPNVTVASTMAPSWDSERRGLRAGKVIVKQFLQPSPNQELILSVFEEEHWPAKIDDPLPPRADVEEKQRLKATIRSLNACQLHHLVRFFGDGTGHAVRWEFVSSDSLSRRKERRRKRRKQPPH